ncbi:MAG: DUF2437 domain-containing protein, partial [Burkholderiaceae bacterium]|nr:DUF2437 domain-containing protein [Burkholderiaceae bacterium]
MKLARYTLNGQTSIGVVRGDRVIELARILPGAPATIRAVLAAGPELLRQIE